MTDESSSTLYRSHRLCTGRLSMVSLNSGSPKKSSPYLLRNITMYHSTEMDSPLVPVHVALNLALNQAGRSPGNRFLSPGASIHQIRPAHGRFVLDSYIGFRDE